MKDTTSWSFAIALLIGCQATPTFAEELAKGHYYWEGDVESFIPCGSDNAFWVVGEKEVLQSLRDKVSKLITRNQALQPLYVELTGHFEDNSDREGIAADYDGLYRIGSVINSTPDSPATCPVLDADD